MRAAQHLLAGKNFEDASDCAVALQHNMSHSPQHGTEVERFTRMVIQEETPVTSAIVVEMRQHLVMLLCMLLKDYKIHHLRRRARRFAYQVASRVLRQLFPRESVLSGAPRPASTNAHDLLSPQLQVTFLNYCMTQDENVHFERYDITQSLARKVGRTQAAEGAGQLWRRKEKKLMKTIYQRIEWATGDISWVAREVVRIELRNSGVSDEGAVDRECDKIMKDACFLWRPIKLVQASG